MAKEKTDPNLTPEEELSGTETEEEGQGFQAKEKDKKKDSWYRVRLFIIGTSPLLMSSVQDETLEFLRTGARQQKLRDRSREDEAKEKLYTSPNGSYGIPADNLFACLVEAGRKVPYERRANISTAESSLLPSILVVEEEFLEFPPQWQRWFPNVKRGTNPNGGEMVAICRPLFSKWGFFVTLRLRRTPVVEDSFKKLFAIAGSAVGLCDFRPDCRGRYGCFQVIKWEYLGEIVNEDVNYDEELGILEEFAVEKEAA